MSDTVTRSKRKGSGERIYTISEMALARVLIWIEIGVSSGNQPKTSVVNLTVVQVHSVKQRLLPSKHSFSILRNYLMSRLAELFTKCDFFSLMKVYFSSSWPFIAMANICRILGVIHWIDCKWTNSWNWTVSVKESLGKWLKNTESTLSLGKRQERLT